MDVRGGRDVRARGGKADHHRRLATVGTSSPAWARRRVSQGRAAAAISVVARLGLGAERDRALALLSVWLRGAPVLP